MTYADEVMLREAAGSDVVLQQLLGEVLVHLRCFVGIHGVPKGIVQVCRHIQDDDEYRSLPFRPFIQQDNQNDG